MKLKLFIFNIIICLMFCMIGCTKVEKQQSSNKFNETSNEQIKKEEQNEMYDITENIKSQLPIKNLMVECVFTENDYSNITYFIGNSDDLGNKSIQKSIEEKILENDNKFKHIKVIFKNGKQTPIIEKNIRK